MLLEKAPNGGTAAAYTQLPGIWGGEFSYKRGASHRFLVPDLQGHTRYRTTEAAVVDDEIVYDAWGREMWAWGTHTDMLKAFGQHGYWRDTASRLYVRARQLRVDLGRWLSRDPLGFAGGDWNVYGYLAGMPVGAADPSGLACRPVAGYLKPGEIRCTPGVWSDPGPPPFHDPDPDILAVRCYRNMRYHAVVCCDNEAERPRDFNLTIYQWRRKQPLQWANRSEVDRTDIYDVGLNDIPGHPSNVPDYYCLNLKGHGGPCDGWNRDPNAPLTWHLELLDSPGYAGDSMVTWIARSRVRPIGAKGDQLPAYFNVYFRTASGRSLNPLGYPTPNPEAEVWFERYWGFRMRLNDAPYVHAYEWLRR